MVFKLLGEKNIWRENWSIWVNIPTYAYSVFSKFIDAIKI